MALGLLAVPLLSILVGIALILVLLQRSRGTALDALKQTEPGMAQPGPAGGRQTETVPESGSELAAQIALAQKRGLIALAVAATALMAGFVAASASPRLVGMPLAIAPASAGSLGLLAYAAVGGKPGEKLAANAARTASLEARSAGSMVGRRTAALLAAAALVLAGVLVATGITSVPDEMGRYRVVAYAHGDLTSAASPYPGWHYAIPMLITLVTLCLSIWAALKRIASTRAIQGVELAKYDRVWRTEAAKVIGEIGGALLSLQLAGVLFTAGMSAQNVLPAHGAGSGLRTLAYVAIIASLVSLLVCIVLAARCLVRVLWQPTTIVAFAAKAHAPDADEATSKER